MLVDCGLPLHYASIAEDLKRLTADCHSVDMIMTRREADNILNLPALISALGIETVYCPGIIDPLDFFDTMDEKNAIAQIVAETRKTPKWLVPGASIAIGTLSLRVMRAEFRILSASYLHEQSTGTFFGADSWGNLPQSDPSGMQIVREHTSALSAEEIIRTLEGRYEWMLGANLSVVRDTVQALRQLQPLNRICGTFGSVIEGPETISRIIDEVLRAFSILERRPLMDRLKGFDRATYESALKAPATVA
ncbi:hypothetical protein J2T08_005712 [Neorhizobium galegae]|nr:hypothetical protein [Neorhizobium galegae]